MLAHPLGLLGDEQGELEVVEPQRIIVQLVSIRQEAHMLDCVVCLFGRLFCRRGKY